VAAALAALRTGATLQIWGDGETVRDFIYIDDLVDLAIRAAISGECGVFNAGSGQGQSLNDVRRAIERVSGRALQVAHRAPRGFDPRAVVLDISAARTRFGWQPTVALEDGLARTWHAVDASVR
jgi:UDP-glucose 4-epimerase